MPRVALDISKNSIDQRINKIVELSGAFGKTTDNVIIKPNLCSRKGPESGATTDPKIVEALIKYFLGTGVDSSRILVVESENAFRNLEKTFNLLGYSDMAEKYDVRLINLSKTENMVVKGRNFDGEIRIAKLLLKDKFYLSVAKLKTHCQEWISCSLKNQFGCISNKDKVRFHPDLPEVIADVNHIIRPNMAVVDGIPGMEGYGPIMGKPVETNLLMCSSDLVALDTVACRVMGLNPLRVGHIRLCRDLGNAENIELCGAKLTPIGKKFRQDIWRHMSFVLLNRYLRIPK